MDDKFYMEKALALAEEAGADAEVPVGAVVVHNGKIIGSGRNRREKGNTALAHAEIEAIHEACRNIGSWRLHECELFVTLEPCPMCAGAIINSRLSRVVFGAYDKNAGACGSVFAMFEHPLGHKPQLIGGYMEYECKQILTDFFKNIRD